MTKRPRLEPFLSDSSTWHLPIGYRIKPYTKGLHLAQKNERLDEGDTFPTLTCQTLDDDTLTLPADLAGNWSILILYRGTW